MYVFIKNLTTIELISTSKVFFVCLYSHQSTQTQQHYITVALQCIGPVLMMCKLLSISLQLSSNENVVQCKLLIE
jgi:hypothetical protein